MFTGLKPYPEYENRGPSRLSHVPSPWSVRRLKHIVRNVVEQSDTRRSGDTYIALEHVESWTGRVRIDDSATFEGLIKNFSTDDVLFGKLRPYLAKVVRVDFDGVCSGEFFVLRRVGDAVCPSHQ
jgi:type I restriction enzyme S subunit